MGTVACLLLAVTVLHGDEKPSAKDDKTSAKLALPTYFDKLGLTEDQKKKILEVREDYSVKIKDLEEQLRELRRKERKAMEHLLTYGQKDKLRELRNEKAPKKDATKPEDK
jgi:Spy/CpxP family protein refolding chaperone